MDWMNLVSLILNIVFGGGLLVTVFTLRSQRKKADAEAKSAEIDNEEKASKIMVEYIVNPLKIEIDELRKETGGLRKDIRRLQKAIGKIGDCSYANNCPVRWELQSDAAADNKQ